jgi:hypothetical protein
MASTTKKRRGAEPDGIIDPAKLYSFAAIEKQLGLGRAGLRAARDRGLRCRYVGRVGYVLGADMIEYVVAQGRATK